MSKAEGKIAEATSDANGKFILRDIKKGVYDILARSEDSFIINSKATVPVIVNDGKNVIGVTVRLQRGCAIKGRLATSNGFPVNQAKIIGGGVSTFADNEGRFLLKGVLPGAIKVGIFPNAIGSKLMSTTCVAGQTTDIGNKIFTIGPTNAIQGTVVDTEGHPISNAILVAYNNKTSAGYAFSDNDGSFFITGLTDGQYSLVAVAYGYEKLTLANIVSPVDNLKLVMNGSSAQASTIYQYRFSEEKNKGPKILTKILELITPKEAYAAQCVKGYCQDGVWVGVSIDFGGLAMFPGLLGPASGIAAGTFSVGSFFCWNSSGSFQFTQTCTYLGAMSSDSQSIDLGFGFTPIITAWDACCANNDIKGPTWGVVGGLGRAVSGTSKILSKAGATGSLAYDSSKTGPSQYLSFSLAAGVPSTALIDALNGWKKSGGSLSPEGSEVFVSYRECDTDEAVNVFEWWCAHGICL